MCLFCFVSRSIEVVLPDSPPEYKSLPHWLSHVTDSKLRRLLEQGDSQRVRELSLALITVLNEVGDSNSAGLLCVSGLTCFLSSQFEHSRGSARVSESERRHRVRVRSNITRALTALDLSTVSDIQQTSTALAQCTVSGGRGLEQGGRGQSMESGGVA